MSQLHPIPRDDLKALVGTGRFAEAESTGRELLTSIMRQPKADSLAVADILNDLIDSRLSLGWADDSLTRALVDRGLAIREHLGAPNAPALVQMLTFKARCLRAQNKFRDALEVYSRVVDIQVNAFGPDNLAMTRTLNSMAAVYRTLGERTQMRGALERAIGIRQRRLGVDHPDLALLLGNLAVLDMEEGRFDSSLALLRRTLYINELKGKDDLQVGLTLINLGMLASLMGDPEAGRDYYARCIGILELHLGPAQWEVATPKANLGAILVDLGAFEEARGQLEGALAVFRSKGHRNDAEIAAVLTDLSLLAQRTGKAAQAESLLRSAMLLQEQVLGPTHWEVARTKSDLAALTRDRGAFTEAESIYRASVHSLEHSVGADNPVLATALVGLGSAQLLNADLAGARTSALRAERITRDHLRFNMRALPERQALQFASTRARGLDVALSTLPPNIADGAAVDSCWDALIQSRALVLDEIASRRLDRVDASDTVAVHYRNRLVERRRRLAYLFIRGLQDTTQFARQVFADARAEAERAEIDWAAHSAAFRAMRAQTHVGLAQVAAALPGDAVLVAYARYEHWSGPRAGAQEGPQIRPQYIAFVLAPGASGAIATRLGDAEPIDSLVSAWRGELDGKTGRHHAADAPGRSLGIALRRKIWDPIASWTHGHALALIVPDGMLSLVNLAALPDTSGSYLLESGPAFHCLSAERDLVRPGGAPIGRGLLAVGGCAYDGAAWATRAPAGDVRASFRGRHSDCGDFATLHFEPLAGARREALEVAALWKAARLPGEAQTLLAEDATESAWTRLAPGHRVLHLATHGFFLSPECSGGRDVLAARDTRPLDDIAPPAASLRGSPLLAAGLAMVGANRRNDSHDGMEDGIVTAEEIAGLDLSGTELAVLSACETGIGTVTSGEGVLGLRRAFEIAGVHSLVMTLWRVNDLDAQRWVRAFYEGRLIKGLGVAEANRRASLQLMHELRTAGEAAGPSRWGAFIAAGDWR